MALGFIGQYDELRSSEPLAGVGFAPARKVQDGRGSYNIGLMSLFPFRVRDGLVLAESLTIRAEGQGTWFLTAPGPIHVTRPDGFRYDLQLKGHVPRHGIQLAAQPTLRLIFAIPPDEADALELVAGDGDLKREIVTRLPAARVADRGAKEAPMIWGVAVESSRVAPPRLTFTLRCVPGRGAVTSDQFARTRLYVGTGGFVAIVPAMKMLEQDPGAQWNFTNNPEMAVGYCAGKSLVVQNGSLKGTIVFPGLRLRKPSEVMVTWMLVDESGTWSNPVTLIVDFRKGEIAGRTWDNVKPDERRSDEFRLPRSRGD
jgi:hypothetical protein